MKMLSLKKSLLVLFLTVSVLGIQLAQIQRPFFGHFASYQIVSASMARNMLKENFSQLLLPKTDLMIGKKKSLPLNQYPIHSVAAALGAHTFGGSLEFWGRFQAILFNAGSIVLTGLIASLLLGVTVGWITVVLMGLSPFTLIYGQAFMTEASALFFLLFSLWLVLSASCKKDSVHPLVTGFSGVLYSLAIVGRIHFLMLMPVFWFILYLQPKRLTRRIFAGLFFSAAALMLPLAWYAYTYFISIHADNIHTNLFLQLSGRKLADGNYLHDMNYYRHVFDIFSEKILTPLGFPFLFFGVLLLSWKHTAMKAAGILTLGFILGCSVILLFPQKVLDHEFYLYGAFPFCIILAAYGLSVIFEKIPKLQSAIAILFFIMLYFGASARSFAHPLYKYPDTKNDILLSSKAIQQVTKPDDWLIIASRDFSELTYYVDRPCWEINFSAVGKKLGYYFKDSRFSKVDFHELARLEQAMRDPVLWLEYFKDKGARYLVVPDPAELEAVPFFRDYLKQHYQEMPIGSGKALFYSLAQQNS